MVVLMVVVMVVVMVMVAAPAVAVAVAHDGAGDIGIVRDFAEDGRDGMEIGDRDDRKQRLQTHCRSRKLTMDIPRALLLRIRGLNLEG